MGMNRGLTFMVRGWRGPSWWRRLCVHSTSGRYPSRERETPNIFSAVLTMHCKVLRSDALQFPNQTVMQLARTLSMVPLKKLVRIPEPVFTVLTL